MKCMLTRIDNAEGVLTLEADVGDGQLEQPLQSIVSSVKANKPMYFSLGAATRAEFLGERVSGEVCVDWK